MVKAADDTLDQNLGESVGVDYTVDTEIGEQTVRFKHSELLKEEIEENNKKEETNE